MWFVRVCEKSACVYMRMYCISVFVLETHQTHTCLSPKDTSEANYYALIWIMLIWECTVCRRMSHSLVITDWSPTQQQKLIISNSSCSSFSQWSQKLLRCEELYNLLSLLCLQTIIHLSSNFPMVKMWGSMLCHEEFWGGWCSRKAISIRWIKTVRQAQQ